MRGRAPRDDLDFAEFHTVLEGGRLQCVGGLQGLLGHSESTSSHPHIPIQSVHIPFLSSSCSACSILSDPFSFSLHHHHFLTPSLHTTRSLHSPPSPPHSVSVHTPLLTSHPIFIWPALLSLYTIMSFYAGRYSRSQKGKERALETLPGPDNALNNRALQPVDGGFKFGHIHDS